MISKLGSQQRAAVVASALRRMHTLLSDLVPEWRGLGVPAEAVIEKYREAARGRTAGSVEWAAQADAEGRDGTYLQEMLDSALELFETANQSLQHLDEQGSAMVLLSAEELAEAADTWAGSGDPPESVQIDPGTPRTGATERVKQAADVRRLISESGSSVAEVVETLLAAAKRSGVAEADRLRAMHREPPKRAASSATVGSTKQDQLMGALAHLKAQDWEAVEECARRSDRPAALAAARAAMKEVGIHASHELLRAARTSRGVKEGSPVWEVASRALLAAAAWDRLSREQRAKLFECFRPFPEVAELLTRW